MLVLLDRDWVGPVKNYQSPVWGSSSTSGGLSPQPPDKSNAGRSAEGGGALGLVSPSPTDSKKSGERRKFSLWGQGPLPRAANAFLA